MIINVLKDKRFRVILVFLVIFLIGFATYYLYSLSKFRIVSTTPSFDNVTTQTPYVDIAFNDIIYSDSLKLRDSKNIITSRTIKDKTLRLTLGALDENIPYTITIDEIKSTDGEILRNKVFSFDATYEQFRNLPKEQQSYLIENQDQQPYDVTNINYIGFEALENNGLSSEQTDVVKQQFFNYSVQIGTEFRKMTINTQSVVFKLHDVRSSVMVDQLDFEVALGGKPYKAHVENNILTNKVTVRLSNAAGGVVYNSP